MAKVRDKLVDRRRYIRLQVPVKMTYMVSENDKIYNAVAKDISVDGLRFDTHSKTLEESNVIELKLDIPGVINPIHAKGKVMWKRKLSLEDAAPFDVGLEFVEIEEDNKNTFLKFLCDSIYSLPVKGE